MFGNNFIDVAEQHGHLEYSLSDSSYFDYDRIIQIIGGIILANIQKRYKLDVIQVLLAISFRQHEV